MKRIALILLVLLPPALLGQSTTNYNQHRFWVGTAPSSTTIIATGTVYLEAAVFSTGASSDTITMTDRSGACSGNCALLSAVSIAANTTYAVPFHHAVAINGFSIASGSGNVTANLHYDTQIQP
jgi:hypothetical protein